MVQKLYILPVKCKRCGAIFDLWYDLQDWDGDEGIGKFLRENLCWHCRKAVLHRRVKKESNSDEILLELE